VGGGEGDVIRMATNVGVYGASGASSRPPMTGSAYAAAGGGGLLGESRLGYNVRAGGGGGGVRKFKTRKGETQVYVNVIYDGMRLLIYSLFLLNIDL
jgi:hypothetical protein